MIAGAVIGALIATLIALPLLWKWSLGMSRALIVAAFGLVSAAAVVYVGAFISMGGVVAATIVVVLTLVLSFIGLAYRFYRDPERMPPDRADVVVSPADGEVVYIRQSQDGILPVTTKHRKHYALQELTKTSLRSTEATVVGIALNFLDVHVNRAPIGGRIRFLRRFPGRFGSLRQPEMIFENERATLVFERNHVEVAVVMIASRLVRRIVTFVREGDGVHIGDRIGMIRFGSQVDIVLPTDHVRLFVRPGDRVVAGESIVAVVNGVAESESVASESALSDRL